MSQEEILASVSQAARKHLDPALPMPPRMMAAKGVVPLPPRDMVMVLCGLMLDADEGLRTAATASLQKLPDKLLVPVLDGEVPPAVLAVLTTLVGRDELLEKVIVHRATPDAALVALAPTAPARLVEMLAENQERCMRSEALLRGLRQNPNLLRSSLDRVFDFLVRAGVLYDDMPEFSESLARLSPSDLVAAADKVVLPDSVAELLSEDVPPEAVTAALAAAAQGLPENALNGAGEGETADEAEAEEAPTARMPMQKLINGLNAAQKVALAMKGNKEARSILLRDSNRMVATATIRNPRLTEQEVVAAAKSRSINDEVIRIICNSRDMTRSYGVKLALVNNPKTPTPTAVRLLGTLRQSDLRNVAKSKSVPAALAVAARKMLTSKSTGG